MVGLGESLSTPVNAGGSSVTIAIDLRLQSFRSGQSFTLDLEAEDQILSSAEISLESGWQTVTVSKLDWSGRTALSIILRGSGDQSSTARLVLDRAHFDWH